jgi:eukaryotic-like serine/threonine-protein kinase
MQQVRKLVAEIHRRSLWQILSIYLVGSWFGYQVIKELADGVGMPDWVPAFAIVLFLIGLPIVLATAFVQEGVPTRRRPAEPALPQEIRLAEEWPDVTGSPEAGGSPEAAGQPAPPPRPPGGARAHALLTWRRSLAAGALAFVLLGASGGGYVGLRNAGIGPFGSLVASGRLDARDPLIVGDFAGTGTDSVMTLAVSQAFRIGFSQSTSVTVVEPARLRDALQRMGRPGARLDAELTRQLALREGIKGFVTGEVTQAGGRFVLAASLVAAEDGSVLASFTEQAADSTAILTAVDRLARRMRERIGDPYRSLRASPPLGAVTTPSLEALRRFTLGARAYDVERRYDVAITLLEEAIALDSTFAMAWRKLGAVYSAAGVGREKVVHATTKAFEHRDRLTELERYETIAFYHMNVTNDRPRAIAAYRALLELDPAQGARNNLAILYSQQHMFEEAVGEYRRAMQRDSMLSLPYRNIQGPLYALGRFEEADSVIALYARRFGETPDVHHARAFAASARFRYDEALQHAEAMLAAGRSEPVVRATATWLVTSVAGARGRLNDAAVTMDRNTTTAEERGLPHEALRQQALLAISLVVAAGDTARAMRRLEQALAARPLAAMAPLDRPYVELVMGLAVLGRVDRARALLDEYLREVPDELAGDRRADVAWLRASLLRAEGRDAESLQAMRTALQHSICTYCMLPDLARAFDRLGAADSAAHYYQRYVDTPGYTRLWWDWWYLGPTFERLAELYAAAGDHERAAAAAARFVELWAGADAELQPRVAAKAELLRELQRR